MTTLPATADAAADAASASALTTAIVDYLRRHDTRPLLAGPSATPREAADAVWSRTLEALLPTPAWRELALNEHFEQPLTVLVAAVPSYPDLTLAAAVAPLAADHAVTLAALRPCPAGEGHHNLVAVQDRHALAQVLHLSSVGGRVDHMCCRPIHGDGMTCFKLNKADEQHAADLARARADLPANRDAVIALLTQAGGPMHRNGFFNHLPAPLRWRDEAVELALASLLADGQVASDSGSADGTWWALAQYAEQIAAAAAAHPALEPDPGIVQL